MKNRYINTFERISYMFFTITINFKVFQFCDVIEMAIIHKMI
jgi:hypothetical protein